MKQDVTTFIQKCKECARRKTGRKVKAPLREMPVAKEFLDIVSLDIVGPFPVTERGNKYLLTFIWLQLYLLIITSYPLLHIREYIGM